MNSAYVTARRPAEVAREIEKLRVRGRRAFVLRRIDGGGMLDHERLGAARYAAGLHAEVELEGHSSPASLSGAGSAGAPAAGAGAK